MRRHFAYLGYVLRHKWFVMLACHRVGASLWRALWHDMSKFHPAEWGPYARTFYGPGGVARHAQDPLFDAAWLHHQHRNAHHWQHWQHWLLRRKSGDVTPLEMPRACALEMVADWMGAGRAITGGWEYQAWYAENRDTMLLHPDTRALVEMIVGGPAV